MQAGALGTSSTCGERRRALRTIEPETLELTVASGMQRGEHFAGANQNRPPYRPPNRTTASAVRAWGRVWPRLGHSAVSVQCPVCPKADMAERGASARSVPQPHAPNARDQACSSISGNVGVMREEIGARSSLDYGPLRSACSAMRLRRKPTTATTSTTRASATAPHTITASATSIAPTTLDRVMWLGERFSC
jgi:hypothetical protein